MRFFVFVCFLVLANAGFHSWIRAKQPKDDSVSDYPPAQWFKQRVDHSNFQDQRMWQQRFFVNSTFFNRTHGGPIFFMLGGEGAISGRYVVDYMISYYAKSEGALVVALEHRFYGESNPFSLMSIENLVYLSSEQALADAAYFITMFKANYSTAGDIIVFGGSYSGNLAAWFRLKYPFIATAAVASSAPVLAELDMTQYLDVVGLSLTKMSGIECDANIHLATYQIQGLLQTPSGKESLSKIFKTCDPIDTPADVATFMSNLMGTWMEATQYNTDLPPLVAVKALCNIMDNSTKSPILRYADVVLEVQGPSCLDVSYSKMIASLKNETDFGSTGVGIRQWTYQTCTEFGYFQSTDSPHQPFGTEVPLSYYINMCYDVFGFSWLPLIDETNINYGGKHPQGSKILFINGGLDPWSSLSITTSLPDSLFALVIPDTSHCADMLKARLTDPSDLADSQLIIALQIHRWLT